MKGGNMVKKTMIALSLLLSMTALVYAQTTVNLGLNYPKTGPYSVQGLAQLRAARMAVEEINASGGVNGKKINLVVRDSQSRPEISKKNVEEMIDQEECRMIFGGSSSAVAIEGGKAAKSRKRLYFGTLTYSNATTGVAGHKYMFRECYNSWMGARVLAHYLREKYLMGKRYFYITADYTWGWTTEDSIRKFSNTSNTRMHQGVKTPFPNSTEDHFREALAKVEKSRANVLVLVLFGKDMSTALKIATEMGLKEKMDAVVVPNLVLGMASEAGPEVMEGVLGAVPWCWNIPYKYNYPKGKTFVEKFASKYGAYPSSSAASAYTIIYQYKDAAERADTFDTEAVIQSLEGHRFTSLKDKQVWREFDHQCVQTVYAVKCKPADVVKKDKFQQDYFEVVNVMSGEEAAKDEFNWKRVREKAGMPENLE